jgi:hypothetical protein
MGGDIYGARMRRKGYKLGARILMIWEDQDSSLPLCLCARKGNLRRNTRIEQIC